MKNFQIAIDGPAGSGKSSISKIIAKELGFVHIDTGAMYRAVTLDAINRGIDLNDENQYDFINEIDVQYIGYTTYLNGIDVSDKIRTPMVSNSVSLVSSKKIVRDKMLEFQRKSASQGLVLLDGRDIGTVVLPNADLKFFLTASKEERAKRRYKELLESNNNTTLEEVLNSMIERDHKDSTRDIAPLVKAEDAILLDTTNLTLEEVCSKIIRIVNERMK